ncbi:hypothetical protein [Streptomyces sp. NPDC094049]|uniref:hypothetical protein n=1 Tax=Streptomyces sp. NPDC094049 TaxID=3154987 RepID=UPI003329F6DC
MTSVVSVAGRSLRELIDRADERALAAAGLACLDRCLPLLAADAGEALRPVWAAVARGDGRAWGEAVAGARAALTPAEGPGPGVVSDAGSGPGVVSGPDAGPGPASGLLSGPVSGVVSGTADAEAVRGMLAAAPGHWTADALRDWADGCSATALALHGRYDAGAVPEGLVERCRSGDAAGAGPLLAGELRRQQAVLEATAHGPTGLRRARELSVEGGRVLRAVVSRRARTA